MQPDARLYQCVRCHAQVFICPRCDRGNRYCGSLCRDSARQESLQRAGRLYQCTRQGRFANAARQRRYRIRQRQKVTHQGSQLLTRRGVLFREGRRCESRKPVTSNTDQTSITCHFCRCACEPWLRRNFIQRTPRTRWLH